MEEINVIDGIFHLPLEFRRCKKGIVITQHRVKEMIRGRCIQTWFRNKPEKPYLPEDIIEFKAIGTGIIKKYKVKRLTTGELLDVLFSCEFGMESIEDEQR